MIFIFLLFVCTACAEEWTVEKIADGLVFTEGPVWIDNGLVFSDVIRTESDGFITTREAV